jgi:hypothetical protein
VDCADKCAENLIEPGVAYTITQLNSIFTATQDGKIPFISADDIADVAFHALTDEKAPNCDLRISGPEVLTYDAVRLLLFSYGCGKFSVCELTDYADCGDAEQCSWSQDPACEAE